MALDVIYSRNIGLLDGASADRILALLRRLGFGLFAGELLHLDANQQPVVFQGLEEFREHLGGTLTLTLLKGIGRSVEVHEIVPPKMAEAIHELEQRDAQAEHRILRAG
jgi:3-dehydroquinate synthase